MRSRLRHSVGMEQDRSECFGGLFEPGIARLVHADASLIGLTVLVSIAATVVAALYPTWRAAQTEPAWQIKINP